MSSFFALARFRKHFQIFERTISQQRKNNRGLLSKTRRIQVFRWKKNLIFNVTAIFSSGGYGFSEAEGLALREYQNRKYKKTQK
jgi:hypothetical protein